MKDMAKLTFFKGVIIIAVFSVLVVSCINVAMQGESDLSGIRNNPHVLSIARESDSRLRVHLFDSAYYLSIPPFLRDMDHLAKGAADSVHGLVSTITASLRQSLQDLNLPGLK
jgi:alpha-tubulin suppressor-like RCC1 family protein